MVGTVERCKVYGEFLRMLLDAGTEYSTAFMKLYCLWILRVYQCIYYDLVYRAP